MPRKADAADIEAFWLELPNRLQLDARRAWWPKYLYRFDDIREIAEILGRGALYCRERREAEGISAFHSANAEVIAQTPHLHGYARLYFRPLTPTQFHMEGVLAKSRIRPTGEHCPIPVFLCFDAPKLLCEEGVLFTDSAPTRIGRYHVGSTAEFLRTIEFERVYHDEAMAEDEKRTIVARRHAEVLIEGALGLEHLTWIICRTGAERDTLLYLLGDTAAPWEGRIRVAPPGFAMFKRRGAFVDSGQLIGSTLHIRMSGTAYTYDARIEVRDPNTGRLVYEFSRPDAQFKSYWTVDLGERLERALVDFTIEGAPVLKAILSQPKLVGE